MRLFVHELKAQQRLFWRSRELAFFTFMLPVLLFFLLGSTYGDDEIEGVRGADYLLAGMLGYGAVSTTFAGPGDPARRPPRAGHPQAPARDSAAGVDLPGGGARLDRARLRARGGADAHDRAAGVRHRPARPLAVARARAPARLGRVRRPGGRPVGPRPQRRGLLGRRERDLPAAVVHLRRVLLAGVVPRLPAGDRRACFR